MKKDFSVKKLVLLAMLTAVSFVMATIQVPVVLFLSYEPKDVIITVGGFLLGPMASLIISFLVALLEMLTISTTGPIGAVMNFLSSAVFSCTAAWIYKKKHTLAGAVLGLAAGSLSMIGTMLLWNYLITPLYMTGTSRSDVASMLVPVFLPYNALKAGLNSAFVLGLYKPLAGALRKTGLLQASQVSTAGKSKAGVYILAALLLVTCILLLLVYQGKI